ncbi:MAG: GGDEF domain-containing protein [Pirellulales bacterium]
MTKLANRAEFDQGIRTMVKETVERRQNCGLIITDIDRFKSVNDTFGHQVGDEVLIAYSQLLKTTVPQGYLAARYGGEEFVVLCPDSDLTQAAALAEKLRVALSQINHSGMGGKAVTASFGVTEMLPGDSPEIMLRRADRGLYTAKEEGRNRVVSLGGRPNGEQTERRKKRWWQWGTPAPRPEVKSTLDRDHSVRKSPSKSWRVHLRLRSRRDRVERSRDSAGNDPWPKCCRAAATVRRN